MTAGKFVIVVDAQRDFMMPDGALYVPGAEALIAPINDWLTTLDPATTGVLLTYDTHDAADYPSSAEALQFPLHCVRGSPGWQSVIKREAIAAAIPLYALEKGVFAMWDEPDVTIRNVRHPDEPAAPREQFFDDLRQSGIVDVIVVGVAADFCVRWAVDGLLARGFHVVVPTALTRGIMRQIETVFVDEWEGKEVRMESGS